ncbi:TIGR00341 family protein [Synechococcus sp. UW140]|uniref:TIGR00341 family protein n=1 Tax=Synechococcus sp. UW140 TaxID=368503 RepID=UPI000E0F4B71|nr:TIGR00341 family protein [Synechococcus sp. UW140]
MGILLRRALQNISGEWQLNLENRVPREELYQARIASSKPSLGFFVLLICSAVIATLGLIANSTAVVIGAMIVAPLMEPILSLAFGLTVSNNMLAKRSAITVLIGVITVVFTSWLLSSLFGASEINREITSRTAPNLIDLVIAVAAAVAGAFTITRDRLSNSIAGVAIAVALVPPLCVCGIGLSLGAEVVAVFGRGTVTGLSNQVSEGSFLLFLANLIGITVASIVVFMVQRYGSPRRAWRQLLVSLGLLGLLCIPLSSSLHDFSVRQLINNRFTNFKAGIIQNGSTVSENPSLWKRVKLLYSNVRVSKNDATVDLVLHVPGKLIDEVTSEQIDKDIANRIKNDYKVDEVNVNISLIPTQIIHYNLENKLAR